MATYELQKFQNKLFQVLTRKSPEVSERSRGEGKVFDCGEEVEEDDM